MTDDDVRGGRSAPAVASNAAPAPSSGEERIQLRGVRKVIAERMAKSFHTMAQVTLVDEVDMTELVLLREAFKGSAEKKGVKLTFLPLIIKAVIPALKEFPYVNSTLDERSGEIVLKKRLQPWDRGRHAERADGPGREGRRQEGHLRALGGDGEARREGEDRGARPRGGPGLDLHDHEPGVDRRALRDSDSQLPRGRDTRDAQDLEEAGRQGREDRGRGT